jgi:endoglycosylceramidase
MVGALIALPATGEVGAGTPTDHGPTGDLGHVGRWLVDAQGRVVQLHGVNMVSKWPAEDPLTPAEVGFGADDAAFIREQGLNVVRLGVVFGAVMPEPGVIDEEYVASIAETVRVLGDEGIYVQLDFHQDGYGPATHGNGFPEWATLTDGLPNPPAPFPLYYIQNPALQRAFDNFWENAPGPDGVPLQEHYATAMRTVAAAVVDEPFVLGYDTMNEPWPGTVWEPCVTGCPDIEQARLAPFAERMTAAIRSVDTEHFVFTEPFVLFNFGQSDTSLSGHGAPLSGLSFHVYALSADEDVATIDHAIAASARGDAIIATEFGATNDPATIERLTGALDGRLVPWIFWSYDEHVTIDLELPPTGDNVREPVVEALARPYPTATNGTPQLYLYEPSTGLLELRHSTQLARGGLAPGEQVTVVATPKTAYPDGYTVEVAGGWVASEPGADELLICNAPGASEVQVRVSAGATATAPTAPRPCERFPDPVEAVAAERVVATPRFTG